MDSAERSASRDHGRIPTVDEALAFTPLSSIVTFDPAVIPVPLAYSNTAPLQLLSEDDTASANALLSVLDQEARQADSASNRLKLTISDIQDLLRSSDISKITLKDPIHVRALPPQSSPQAKPTQTNRNVDSLISPFAHKLLAAKTVIPASDATRSISMRKSIDTSANGQLRSNPANVSVDESLASGLNASPSDQRTLVKPHPNSPAAPAKHTLTNGQDVVDHSMTADFHITNTALSQKEAAEFEVPPFLEALDAVGGASVDDRDGIDLTTSAAHAHNPKSRLVRESLLGLLQTTFEAEAEFQAGDYTRAHMFQMIDTTDGSAIILHPETQSNVDKNVLSAAKHRELAGIPVEDLAKLQKLCHNTIQATENRFLGIGEGWDETELLEWQIKVSLAQQGLVAARTILRVMDSGIEDKLLFSEDTMTSMLDFLKNTIDSGLVPVLELRSSDDDNDSFRIARSHASELKSLASAITKVLVLLGNVFLHTDMDETVVNTVQSLCTSLLFVENASSESDSALGLQTFEKVRRAAMDALAKLFAHNTDQRQSIFDDVLTSLERLPVSRQSARQFKLPDAKPVQLISALLMRLVQTSAMTTGRTALHPQEVDKSGSPASDDSEEDAEAESDSDYGAARTKGAPHKQHKAANSLEAMAVPAFDAALNNARYITNFLVQRAIGSTKSSGEPYRNLLDIFVEDFINVLGNTDWPASELLLRQLLYRLYEITEGKSSAPSKAMALELMGAMITSMTDLRLHTAEVFQKATDETPMLQRLAIIQAAIDSDELADQEVFSLQGPYRAVIEYLRLRPDSDSNVFTALSFHITQWAYQIARPGGRESSAISSRETVDTMESLLLDPRHFDIGGHMHPITTQEGRLGAALVTMRLPLCRLFNKIFNKLLTSMSGDQASIRSKSLRSVEDVLQRDPSILDRGTFVLNNILRCMTDQSPQVRDAALGLLTTCLQLRNGLDPHAIGHILDRTADGAPLVKRRAIKLAKDVYLRNKPVPIRSRIADALIQRMCDLDPAIVDLVRQTLEEIWITPFHDVGVKPSEDAQARARLGNQASLIIETVKRSPDITTTLQDLFEDVMSDKSKTSESNVAVCKAFVLLMVDAIIDETSLPGRPSQAATMQTLAVFAQARPRLFTSAHIQPLLPYLKNLQSTDDLTLYRFAIIILRCTLPHIYNLPQAILEDTLASLLSNVAKVPGPELKEVANCLWAVTAMTGAPDRLIAVTRSALERLNVASQQNLADEKASRQVERLLLLVGNFVHAFDLDKHIELFRQKFPTSKGSQVVSLALDIVCPLTSPKQPQRIRATALEAMLWMCHAWPKQYQRGDVIQALQLVLKSGDSVLELVLMRAWRDFFVPGSDRRPIDGMQANGASGVGAERIEKTYVATDRDGASTSIAQRFMPDIIRIALHSTNELGSMSAHVVASINKVGLVHPKESASALVALETSPDQLVAKMAFDEHSVLFGKHESIFDKETVRAVQQAFVYQRQTIKDTQGFSGSPPVSKLHYLWEVLKNASARVRKKFLSGICTHVDFDLNSLDLSSQIPVHVELTAFCVQNLALFDFTKQDDLLTLVEGLEKVFSSTGTTVLHGIEAALSNKSIDGMHEGDYLQNGTSVAMHTDTALTKVEDIGNLTPTSIGPDQMRRLTSGSQILILMWDLRTFIRRVYSLAKSAVGQRGRPSKDPSKAKEVVRAPQRVPNATLMTERFLTRTQEVLAALESEDKSREICLQFQRLMSVDDEVKVKAEGDGIDDSLLDDSVGDFVYGALGTPSGDDDSVAEIGAATPGKRGRKRKSTTPGQTPMKKRAGSKSGGQWRGRSVLDEEDDGWD